MFKQRVVPTSELVSTPTPRPVGQSMEFRPPEKPDGPPKWWGGPLAGECAGGGGFGGVNVIQQWWVDIVEPNKLYSVQVTSEDVIVGNGVRRAIPWIEARIKNSHLSSAQARRLAVALIEAADLIDRT